MENRDRPSMEPTGKETPKQLRPSPWARYWARQRRIPQDSHLVSFGDKVTYTFAIGTDAASLHYDKKRGEIFYKGHKITRSDLDGGILNLLRHFQGVLEKSEFAEQFYAAFQETLEKMQ